VPALVIYGATAAGKTQLLEELFASNNALFPAEVISADSMQVYKGMNIGTAKPSAELCSKLPHHLIDICGPGEQFNAGDFVRLAKTAMKNIEKKNKIPVIAGGTGFYINNLVSGLPESPPSNAEIRAALKKELEDGGVEALFDELAESDPVSAHRIHKNDNYRLLRALEVFRLTGKPLSSFKMNNGANSKGTQGAEEKTPGAGGFFVICLERDREDLYKRINLRTAKMFQDGLSEEVKALFEAGFTPAGPAMRAIGYREFFNQNDDGSYSLLEGLSSKYRLSIIEEAVAQNSRRYAKRQVTYSKNFEKPGLVLRRVFFEKGRERSNIEKAALTIKELYGV